MSNHWDKLDSIVNTGFLDINSFAEALPSGLDPEAVYDYMKLNFPGHIFGQISTPNNISKLIWKLAQKNEPKNVADLCSGIGNLSRFFYRCSVDGYEINETTVQIAQKIHPNNNFYNQCVVNGEISKKYDTVISHPPFGLKIENELITKALSLLLKDGRLFIIVNNGFLTSLASKKLRTKILEEYSLEHIINFPKNTFPNTSIESALLIIKNNGKTHNCKSSEFDTASNKLINNGKIPLSKLKNDWKFFDEKANKEMERKIFKKLDNQRGQINLDSSKKTTLGQYATIINGYNPKKEERKDKGKFLIVGGRNIVNNQLIKTEKDSYLSELNSSSQNKYVLEAGDIVITGLFAKRKIYQYKDSDPKAIANNSLKIIRSKDNEYLNEYFNTNVFRENFLFQCEQKLHGSIIPSISLKNLSSIEIFQVPIEMLKSITETEKQDKLSYDSIIKSIDKNVSDKDQKKHILGILKEVNEDPILKLSKQHESEVLEFKSSFKTDLNKKGIPSEEIRFSSLKTIAAFCNTKGGDLLIGVDDDNKIIGVEVDKFSNLDKFKLHLKSKIEVAIKPDPFLLNLIEISSFEKNNKTIVRINVTESPKEVFVKKNKNSHGIYFIRKGPSSASLSARKMLEHIKSKTK